MKFGLVLAFLTFGSALTQVCALRLPPAVLRSGQTLIGLQVSHTIQCGHFPGVIPHRGLSMRTRQRKTQESGQEEEMRVMDRGVMKPAKICVHCKRTMVWRK